MMILPKVGQVWVSEAGRKAEVTEIDSQGVHVEVERLVTKNGQTKVEIRERIVPMSIWYFFSRGYQEASNDD